MSNAYLQLLLEEESKKLVAINTLKGLFVYNQLPFGIYSAPAIFQRCIETLLWGLKEVSVYLDDILIKGSTMEERLTNLDAVLCKLQEAGLHLNSAKRSFMNEAKHRVPRTCH